MKSIKPIVLLATILLIVNQINAQKLIAVQNGETHKFYSVLQDAITNAQNKDTIYIPGGVFSLTNSSITIDKELHLIGVGHYPDSSAVQGITYLNGSITLISGANYSSFEGFYLNGDINSGTPTSNEDVDNITISRCNCGSLTLDSLSTNWVVYENEIRGVLSGYVQTPTNGHYTQNNLFSNNIFTSLVYGFGHNNEFKNNLFLFNGYFNPSYIVDCTFKNNIFCSTSSLSSINSSVFNNNLFTIGFTIPSGCVGINNIINQDQASIFVNQSGNEFNYTHDYHLNNSSPGKNAGSDGTDIGIYGGIYPWKESSIPTNPHLQSARIAHKTDSNGNLNVQIKVAAQEN